MIEMCEFYDPLINTRCWRGHKGSLKCHSKNNCPDYEPSREKESKFDKRIMDEALAYGYGIEPDVAMGGSHG